MGTLTITPGNAVGAFIMLKFKVRWFYENLPNCGFERAHKTKCLEITEEEMSKAM